MALDSVERGVASAAMDLDALARTRARPSSERRSFTIRGFLCRSAAGVDLLADRNNHWRARLDLRGHVGDLERIA